MKDYYLGLDIGTDSVGYAATDTDYNLLKYKGKFMWGSHLFDAGENRDARRKFRSARRRLDRKQQRVRLIREIFAREIAKVDPTFFTRLDETILFAEDASTKKGKFINEEYNDKDFNEQYPTIHHLIADLIQNKEPHDVRHVYLACSWLVAHRGHFLSQVDKENITNLTNFETVYGEFLDYFEDNKPWNDCDVKQFESILEEKISKRDKKAKVLQFLYGEDKSYKTDETVPSKEKLVEFLCGSKVKMSELFKDESYEDLPSKSVDMSDDDLAEVESVIGDNIELIRRCKAVNDCIVLKEVLNGSEYISFAKVDVYKQHQKDLAFLKHFMKKYLPKKYDDMFRNDIEGNYVAYSGNTKSLEGRKSSKKSANSEVFLNYVKATVKAVTTEEEDQNAFDDMIKRIELGTFMPKQVNSNNRVIPYQVYWNELNAILQNAKEYLPFLQETDDAGYSNIEKILSTFEFRVPYYVGPLNNDSEKAWVVRTKDPILPWTFKDVVDEDESEKQFINRLINQCTYLPGEDVLPKTSMIYQKFEVLNEINNIKVNGRSIPVNAKQGLFNDLFMRKKKVTVKNIKEYLKCNGYYSEEELETLSGLDITVKSSLSMAISFSALLGNGTLTFEQAEDIILHSTYSEDKTRLKIWIEKTYPSIAAEDVSYLCKLKCKDFGRLSGKFLLNLSGMNNETGEVKTILNWMWDENYNLMQLLSNDFTFVEQIEEARKEYYSGKQHRINDVLDDLYVPNGAKRPIYRTLDIIRDVVKANGGEYPKKIFVEMARGATEDQKNKRTKSRYQQLLDLYKEVDCVDVRELKKSLEDMGDSVDNKLQSDRLFLYYMQLGKCMYTGNPIEISMLYDGKVNIEHIYPQAKVKDDSIMNNEVLVMSEANGQKSDTYPIASEIRSKMRSFWKCLKKNKLITEEKYNRLTRSTPFTQDEQWGFINRQLVETRQSTKAIASILKEKYPNSEIVYVKAGLVSDFRHEFDMLKSRVVNDLHHAKDAYLNIVVGNVYNSIFTKNWFMANYDSNYSIKTTTLFGKVRTVGDTIVWNGKESIDKVQKTVYSNTAQLTKYAYKAKGGLFDQNIVKAKEGLVAIKKGMDTAKYGGYNKPSCSFFMLVRFTVKKKTEVMIIPVDLLVANKVEKDIEFAKKYAQEMVFRITGIETGVEFPLKNRILKKNVVLSVDGFRVCIVGKDSGGKSVYLNPIMGLSLPYDLCKYIKRVESFVNKSQQNSKFKHDPDYDEVNIEGNIKVFDALVQKAETIYTKRPENPFDKLENQRGKFMMLSIVDQCKCILQLVSLFGRIANVGKLMDMGGGACRLNAKLSNWKKTYKEVYIVDVSASGLFEHKSINLLSLL